VDTSELTCCVLPYGTGNDFSRVCGWADRLTFLESAEKLVEEVVLNSKTDPFDVWQVRVKVLPKGDILVVDSKSRKYASLQFPRPEFTRFMLNYMGFGQDARLGTGFDKKRTQNKRCNECIYFWEALKKCCCLSNLDPNRRLEYLAVIDEESRRFDPDFESVTPQHVNHPEGSHPPQEQIFIGEEFEEEQKIDQSQIPLIPSKSTPVFVPPEAQRHPTPSAGEYLDRTGSNQQAILSPTSPQDPFR